MRKGARTELRLRWACCELLEQSGLSDVRVSDICRLAEVAQGTFYQYFVDRDALLRSLLESFVHFLSSAMSAAAKAGRTQEDRARVSTRTYCVLFERNRGLMKCLLNHYETFPQASKILQAFNAQWVDGVVTSITKRRAKRGSSAEVELRRRCYALGAMVDQYLCYIFLSEDPNVIAVAGDIDAIAATLDDVWRRTLSTETGRAW